jgi:tripartite-type tricarboxylate transporter receptor subunit TctC
MTDTISGRVAMYFSGVTAALPLVRSGQVTALGTSGARRSASMPDVPTMAEAGLPQFEVTLWNGLMAPRGTPKEIVEAIGAATNRVLKDPEVQARFAKLGLDAGATTPAEFRAFLDAEIGKWAGVIKSIGLSLE